MVSDDDNLARRIRLGLNHGELAGEKIGLNLRMTEATAAIAFEQLLKGPKIIAERREIAETIIDAAKPLFKPPGVREGCTHSYYMIPWLVDIFERPEIVEALNAEGVPVREGYTAPLFRLQAFNGPSLPVTERVENQIITYENCAWTPTSEQLKQFKEAFKKVGDRYVVSQRDAGTDSGDGREVAGL